MKVVAAISELRAARKLLPSPLGLVPTMGALHDGHRLLVRRARAECASVGVSIFVNPTQFGPGEDLSQYPRPLEADLAALAEEGVDLVWTPTPEIVYLPGFQTHVSVEKVSQPLEGRHRPGHFRGVATMVAKLFHVFTPDRAYFGQKDAQQTLVVKRMVEDLNFPLEIVVCPTVRELDGLAMSSRNQYLNPEERRAATILYRALCGARDAYERGVRDAHRLRQRMSEMLATESLAAPEYVSAADPETLVELSQVTGPALLSLAVRMGRTRLIDNLVLGESTRTQGAETEFPPPEFGNPR